MRCGAVCFLRISGLPDYGWDKVACGWKDLDLADGQGEMR